MGWCSGTRVFDAVAGYVLDENAITPEQVITVLVKALEDNDWDCQHDSAYWDHPLVQKVLRDLHPGWFEEGE